MTGTVTIAVDPKIFILLDQLENEKSGDDSGEESGHQHCVQEYSSNQNVMFTNKIFFQCCMIVCIQRNKIMLTTYPDHSFI